MASVSPLGWAGPRSEVLGPRSSGRDIFAGDNRPRHAVNSLTLVWLLPEELRLQASDLGHATGTKHAEESYVLGPRSFVRSVLAEASEFRHEHVLHLDRRHALKSTRTSDLGPRTLHVGPGSVERKKRLETYCVLSV